MKPQRGVALILSMVILVIAALLGLSSFQSSQLEERMAGNHRFSVSALQAAEAGINDMMDAVLSYNYSPGGDLFCDNIEDSLFGSDFESIGGGEYVADDRDISGGGLIKKYSALLMCAPNGRVIGFSRGVVLDDERTEISARRIRVEIVPPGFDSVRSMLAKGDIEITGNSTIQGNVHSNSNVTLAVKSTGNPQDRVESMGTITATLDVKAGGVEAPVDGECATAICASSGAQEVTVPSAQDFIDAFREKHLILDEEQGWIVNSEADPALEIYVLSYDSEGKCTNTGDLIKPEGSDAEHVYYCPGEIDTDGNFQDVTVMAEGSITHRGAATIDGDPLPLETLVVSGGDITLAGATDASTYAAFWAEGNFRQNGNSAIFGSIVAGGTISSQGGIDFRSLDSDLILVPVSGRLEGWAELEKPGDLNNISG